MTNAIQIFENKDFGNIRTVVDENGTALFCGKDIATALGYSNTKDALIRHCRWVVKRDLPHPQSEAREITMSFIPEGDVYRLICNSKGVLKRNPPTNERNFALVKYEDLKGEIRPEYLMTRNALKQHCRGVVKHHLLTNGGKQEAKAFKHWN